MPPEPLTPAEKRALDEGAAMTRASEVRKAEPILVRVVDIDISFGQMVVLLVKFAIAAIPAAVLLAIIAFVVALFFGGLGRR